MIMKNTPYIERGGDLVVRHPFMMEKTHMRCFFMDAAPDKLQTLCDKLFNAPTNNVFQFRPLSNTVLLAFAQIEKAYSAPDQHHGSMVEVDVAFWIPLLYQRAGEFRLAWYISYVFVDNPYAMASGREIYGFPKTLAQFQIPEATGSHEPYWVDSFGLENAGSGARYRMLRLFELRRTGKASNEFLEKRPFKTAHHLYNSLFGGQESSVTRWQLRQRYLHNLRHKQHVPVLFLRQLRDIQDPNRAAHQEILEAPANITRFWRGGLLPNDYNLHLTPNASFPIAEELGLCPDEHPIKSAFWVDFDFCMDKGQTLWQAGGG
ncbi:MAG: acetoacetate decarboxylase family protein [Chloroflexota bacterium]